MRKSSLKKMQVFKQYLRIIQTVLFLIFLCECTTIALVYIKPGPVVTHAVQAWGIHILTAFSWSNAASPFGVNEWCPNFGGCGLPSSRTGLKMGKQSFPFPFFLNSAPFKKNLSKMSCDDCYLFGSLSLSTLWSSWNLGTIVEEIWVSYRHSFPTC